MTPQTSSDQTTSILAARNLGKEVQAQQGIISILSGLDLDVNRGESVAILGASGAGKSTLLGLLAGLDTITSGEVLLNGQALSHLDEDKRAQVRSDSVGFVFQNFQLLPALTALENAMLPLELKGINNAEAEALQILERVGLASRVEHYPRQLSGGEQQRVAIARAFASRPQLLFADEPTGNLDQHTGEKIIDLLFQLNEEQHTTLILVTHDIRLAERCQRRLELTDGRLEPML
ncbi:ABC transporter ATP-binding protein [Motiliproteus sp. MSK22-1]|uniref:ABC transporter ATP-binding protein n=1 Tax=Motiliproteus sp. MSK22-1 TaxID=1897630 RepID=UPI001E4FB225|nr:ABC transporter ATP-binding protein [Motiliproteus sp. MSK22-1]